MCFQGQIKAAEMEYLTTGFQSIHHTDIIKAKACECYLLFLHATSTGLIWLEF